MKRVSARGIILKGSELILIHRIKEKEEYYVFPDGGIEEGETIGECVVREIDEELGIEVKVIKQLYRLEREKDIEYYVLCEYVDGEIGTGKGPEFTSKAYKDRGLYLPETVDINEIDKIPLQKVVVESILQDLKRYGELAYVPNKDI